MRRPDHVLFADDPDFQDVTCPACSSADTSVQSLTGGSAAEVLFFCNGCRSCFNWIKWNRQLPPQA